MHRWMIVALSLALTAASGCTMPKTLPELRAEGARHMEWGRHQEAAASYQQVLERKPEDTEANLGLGRAYLALDEPLRARRHLAVAYQQTGHIPDLSFEIGRDLALAMGQSGDADAMVTFLRDRAELRGQVRDYLLWGDMAAKFGDPDAAEVAYRTAIRIQPRLTAEPYLRLARFYESLSKTEQATFRLRQAYWIDPDNDTVITALERYYPVVGPSLAIAPER